MREITSKSIAISGISTALVMLSLYGGTFIVINKLFFIGLAVLIGGIPYSRCGIKLGILTYIAASILGFFVLPNKAYAGAYIVLGIYPFIKLVSESKSIIFEFIYKLLWFNLTLILIYYVFKEFIIIEVVFKSLVSRIVLLLLINLAFILYDYIFTRFIMIIDDKLPN